jgi:hypothetical protein
MKATPPKPSIIIAQVEGSGDATSCQRDDDQRLAHGISLLDSLIATICFGNHLAGKCAISGAPRIRNFYSQAASSSADRSCNSYLDLVPFKQDFGFCPVTGHT